MPHRNTTLLIVGSFTGNDYLTPTAILNLPPLPLANILYFPLPNPSGFIANTSRTHPTKIDPSNDFPILGNT